jgi:cell pole-organizing protein PopZ
MLREWLDSNLPPLVERLVERELQKIARRAEGE